MTKLIPGHPLTRETDTYDRGAPLLLIAEDRTVLVRPKHARPGEFAPVPYSAIEDLCRREAQRSVQVESSRKRKRKVGKG